MKNKHIVQKVYRESTLDKIQTKLNMSNNTKMDAIDFMNIRVVTTLVIFIIILIYSKIGYFLAPFISFAYYLLIEYIMIDIPLSNRGRKLDHEALYFFEILTLTLESGRNLEKSLQVTVDNVDSELSSEFRKTLNEMNYGKSLIEALDDMKKRIPSESINNIILNMTQTSIFGSSILETLYNQVDFLRDKQSLEIKGQINKIPNKISIVSVLFVVPLILILILGPFLLTYIS